MSNQNGINGLWKRNNVSQASIFFCSKIERRFLTFLGVVVVAKKFGNGSYRLLPCYLWNNCIDKIQRFGKSLWLSNRLDSLSLCLSPLAWFLRTSLHSILYFRAKYRATSSKNSSLIKLLECTDGYKKSNFARNVSEIGSSYGRSTFEQLVCVCGSWKQSLIDSWI